MSPMRMQRSRPAQLAVDVFGRLDVLVNNAGYGTLPRIEDTTIQDFARSLRPISLASESDQGGYSGDATSRSGPILQFSSVGDASARSVAARTLRPSGCRGLLGGARQRGGAARIKVTIIEPGGFRTDFAGSSQTILADNPAMPRRSAPSRSSARVHGAQPGDPTKRRRPS